MKTKYFFYCIVLLPFLFGLVAQEQLKVSDLRCEYKKDPIGIGVLHPGFSWKLITDGYDQRQTAYQLLVASSPKLLKEKKADLWNSGKVISDQSIHVEYNGRTLSSKDRCWWMVRVWDQDGKSSKWSKPAYFEMGLLSPEDWQAEWIKTSIEFDKYSYPSPMFRKEFRLDKKILRARAYVTSLGLYEMHLNGSKVGEDVLTPGFTSYDSRVQCGVYDITSHLRDGTNAVGIILGNGWYRNFRAHKGNLEEQDRQDLFVIAQLEVSYADGSVEIIATGPEWKSSTGPVLMTSIYDGEIYDARKEKTGWTQPGYNESGWEGVVVAGLGKQNIVPNSGPPIRRIEEIKPIAVLITPEGDTVLDMGQNMVGWCRLKVNCPTGTVITLRHGEVLDKNGNFYTANLRTAKQTITYICRGGGLPEMYEPRFTFQGFRYVAVSGYPGEITPDLITGVVVHSDMKPTGLFTCSDSMVNRLHHAILWVQKCNALDVPTDCPQRDERCGWGGDAQLFAPAACFNLEMAGFYSKWLKDLAADQSHYGFVCRTAPDKMFRIGGVIGWGDAAVIVPWLVYRRYGDERLLKEQYKSMKDWVDYLTVEGDRGDHFAFSPRRQMYGDWLAFKSGARISNYAGSYTDRDMLAVAYYYHSTDLLQRAATVLGHTQDAAKYLEQMVRIRDFFQKEYITASGRLSPNTQTAYAVALSFGLIPEEMEMQAAQRLVNTIKETGHITTGLMGTREICPVLTKYGHNEEAYKLLLRKEYPSWLYMVDRGATTIWERWDSMKPDSTFQGTHMNSFNHPALGSVGDWLYRKVGGIDLDPEIPGYKSIMIKPYPGEGLDWANTSYESPYGTIRCEWKKENGNFRLRVEIPVNTIARIYIPSTGDLLKVNEKQVKEWKVFREENLDYEFCMFEAGSGTYELVTEFHE